MKPRLPCRRPLVALTRAMACPLPIRIATLSMLAVLFSGLSAPAIGHGRAPASTGSLAFFESQPADYDYGLQLELPPTFGTGEFTLELWIRPDESYPIGSTADGPNQLTHWSDADEQPYSSCCWWFEGNFLLDGHNNATFSEGTFSLQLYGGGRLRWLVGDGASSSLDGGIWSVGAYPATTTPSLLDGEWHRVALVRRFSGVLQADYELWIDGSPIATETSPARADFTTWWASWSMFPSGQEGWFWAVEKQAAIGVLSQYEDYKGPIDELRFFDRALSPEELARGACETSTGLVAEFAIEEGAGAETCDTLDAERCISLVQLGVGAWSGDAAPQCGSVFTDGFESGNTGAWQ